MKDFYAKNALAFLLPAYLFAGIYKNTIPLPWGDWTALLALLIAITCLILYRSCLPLIREPRFWLLGFLICYLGIRSWPMTEWGTYKLAEVVVLGGPALCAGYLLANDMQRFGRAIASIAVIVALYAAIKACITDTVWSTTEVLSGGYQLTSGLLAYGLMAIVLDQAIPNLLRFFAVSAIGFGLALVGSMVYFYGVLAVLAVILLTLKIRGWRPATAWVFALALPLFIFTVTIGPPAAMARLAWKADVWTQPVQNTQSGELTQQRMTLDDGRNIDSTSRLLLWQRTIKIWHKSPWLGHGFGAVEYTENYRTAHNVILELLAEGGLIAGALGLAFFAAVVVPAWLNITPATAYIVGLTLLSLGTLMVGGYFLGRLEMFALGACLAIPWNKIPISIVYTKWKATSGK